MLFIHLLLDCVLEYMVDISFSSYFQINVIISPSFKIIFSRVYLQYYYIYISVFYMENRINNKGSNLFKKRQDFFRKCFFLVPSFDSMSNYMTFTVNIKHKFAQNMAIKQDIDHEIDFASFIYTLQYY